MKSDAKPADPVSVLVVEDDKQAADILGIVIRRKFPEVIIYSAENGRVGLQLFKAHAPDIVITDINMPEMDGIQMAKEIKAIRGSTKFIVVTAFSNASYHDTFMEIGFCDYLLKPIEFTKLFAALGKCMEETKLEQHGNRA